MTDDGRPTPHAETSGSQNRPSPWSLQYHEAMVEDCSDVIPANAGRVPKRDVLRSVGLPEAIRRFRGPGSPIQ